ncbi:capsular polysaccharide biosynthesis protein [Tenuifilaceae bacterium CYCD]|nr:capsular polysaccharide biosynthesis protein [Tenuifilaceae bacterium CYCD]
MESKKDSITRVAWVHNYDRSLNSASGVFMYQLYAAYQNSNSDIAIDLINIGSITKPFLFIAKIFKYRKLLRGYDIIHAQYGSGTGFFVSLFGKTRILSLRGSDWYKSPANSLIGKFHIWLGCKLSRWSLTKFDQIIVMSERMKADVLSFASNSKITVIPDGIDLNRFYPQEHVVSDKFRVLFSTVDKTNPVKRYDLAVSAFSLFHCKYPNSELVLMTGVDHDRVNEFINSVDVILLTSTHEGWPNIIKEGLACNVPFVSTDVSDLCQIANSSDTCFVCEDFPESLFVGLEKVYCNRTRPKELRHFVEFMDLDSISDELIAIYRDFEI